MSFISRILISKFVAFVSLLLLLLLVPVLPSLAAPVRTGAELLSDTDFARLSGIKFGLITNQTATIKDRHLLAAMQSSGVSPAVIFVPEHGLKGEQEDGVRIADTTEQGIIVRSLYGGTKKPRKEDLAELQLLVFDIQDIGARFYTYISTLGLVMQATAEEGLPLLILDRPNPLGGDYLSGFVSRVSPPSFTAFYPIPIAHGMTVGELARMIKGEKMLPGLDKLDLSVMKMTGWERRMRWPDTGLAWTATSPNIPDYRTALLYAGVGLLEGTKANEGRGTLTPFKLAGYPNLDGERLARELNSENLPGLGIVATSYTPRSIPGKSSSPKHRDKKISGVSITLLDHSIVQPVETGVALLSAIFRQLPAKEREKFFHNGINDLGGNDLLRKAIERGMPANEITRLWEAEVKQFRLLRTPYLLY